MLEKRRKRSHTNVSNASVIRTSRVSQTLLHPPSLLPSMGITHQKGLGTIVYKRPTFAFTGESWYTLAFRRKIAHNGSHAETGGISDGALSLPSTRTARSRTSPGRVPERRALPLLGLGRGCSQRTQRAFGTAMRLCASLFRGVAAPLGCVIFFASAEIAVCTSCAQGFPHVWGRGGITTLSALCVLLKYRTAACQSG